MMKTFTRGGQITFHSAKMIKQVLSLTFFVTLFVGCLGFIAKSYLDYSPYERRAGMAYYWADFKTNFPLVRADRKKKMTQYYTYEDGTKGIVYSLDILNDPWHQSLAQRMERQRRRQLV